MSATLGMIGTGEWSNEERPKRYREGILKLYPNGDVPLTAIQSKGRSRKVDDPEFKWWDKDLATQGGAITEKYKVYPFATAWGAGDAAAVGDMIYCKVAEATAEHFREGHTVLLVDSSDDSVDVFGKVTGIVKNGASSCVSVIVRYAADAGNVYNSDYLDIVGNANPEGGYIPDAVTYKPTKYTNYTQILRTPLDITRTQRKTRMRTGDVYTEAKLDALLYHGVEIENASFFSYATEVTGSNNQKERTTEGMIQFIKNNSPAANVTHYPDTTALSWKMGGEDWVDETLELVFRYGRSEKMAFCGSGALLGLMKLVKQAGNFQLTTETASYGVKVARWVTPFGDIMLKRHPLFSFKTHRQNSMVVFEPENLQFVYIDDTFFKADDSQKKAGQLGYDGTKEEYLTEFGYEYHFPKTYSYMTGVGVDGS